MRLFWTALFAVAFALVETSVVVYLRALYYPDGFAFPLRVMEVGHLKLELIREAATIAMLASVGGVAGRRSWEGFGYFLVAFGVWDVFYYIWLKVVIGWPASLLDWDVLFLIPAPWIGPVIAPVLVALMMIGIGLGIILRARGGYRFRPGWASWLAALLGTGVILYSFVSDTDATLGGAMPQPYAYWQLIAGLLLYALGYRLAHRPDPRPGD